MANSAVNKGRGYIRDHRDPRDDAYQKQFYDKLIKADTSAASADDASTVIDLRAQCPPIYDQGGINSCTANAIAAALLCARSQYVRPEDDKFSPSRLYIYYNERRMEEPADGKDEQYYIIHDSGARIRNGIKSLQKYGVCSEIEHWPYASDATDPNQDNLWTSDTASERHPPSTVLDPATNDFKIEEFKRYLGTEFSYYSIADASSFAAKPMSLVTQLEKCLIAGFPFIFGLIEYADANLNEHVDENGVFVDPPKDILDVKGVRIGPDPIGGHAILCVGCDQQEKRFLIRNSYGPDWGTRADEGWPGETWGKKDPTMAGHFWLPYSWFEKNISDIWVIDATKVQAPG